MKIRTLALASLFTAAAAELTAQEASAGLTVPVTVSGQLLQSPRGIPAGDTGTSSVAPAFRAVLYPSLKLGEHWFAFSALQVYNRPYFYEQLDPGERVQRKLVGNVLQAYIGYSRIGQGKGFTIKAGQLTTAFGNFALRYDDMRNWLIDLPQNHGYYYTPVSVTGLPGIEADFNIRKWDARVQLTNSSPANPRKLWQSDQYPVWTAGGGYTIRQELRVGASAYYGPYLDRAHRFFRPGEARPVTLPATGYGIDIQFAKGKWNANGELQRFQFPYRATPYFFNTSGYAEVKYRAGPRWYLAGRAGRRSRTGFPGKDESYETVVGVNLAPGHLLKFGFQTQRGERTNGLRDRVFAVQYAFRFDALNIPFR